MTVTAIPLEEAERQARQQTPPAADGQGGPWPPTPEPAPPQPLPTVAYADIEPSLGTADFVEGLLIDGGLSLVFGPANCGKTFWATDLGLHVALGWPWFGRAVEGGGVLYLAGEGGSGIRNRVAAFRAHHGAGAAGEDVPFAILPVSLDLCTTAADTAALVATVRALGDAWKIPVRLVIVDTVSRAMAGGDENDNRDMGALVRNLDRVRAETGVHVLAVHHSGKEAGRGARGHSLLRAAIDTEIEVSRDEDAGTSTAKVTKQREMPVAGEICFRLEVVELGANRRGKPVTSCVVEPAEAETSSRSKPLSQRDRLALEKLQDLIVREGVAAPFDEHYPDGSIIVSLNSWREYLRKSGVTSDENATERQQWKRHKENLMASSFIAIWNDFVWLVRS